MKYFILFMAGFVWLPQMTGAEEPSAGQSGSALKPSRFEWDLRVLAFDIHQQPADSTQNPSNSFLHMPRYLFDSEVRPDLRLNLGHLELSVKPRMKLSYSAGWDDDWSVNEWLARWRLRENIIVSYGRENLQWGPSFLFSPSNPFFPDNGRRGFYSEVPGMDFGRLIWLPGGSWGVSFIANVSEGANKTKSPGDAFSSASIPDFEKTYAIKTDYTGRQRYASLIVSRKGSQNALGIFGGWTASDAILLYGEGTIAQGSEAFYPVKDPSLFGASMEKLHAHDAALYPAFLAGGAYTFQSKGTLTAEYAYYGPGYTATEADRYYALRSRAATAFESAGPISGPARLILYNTAMTGLRFLRRNYSMVQYTQSNIANRIGLTFRWTQSLNEKSGQIAAFVSCVQGKHMELFSIGAFTAGKKDMEFNSLLARQIQLGLKYTF